MASKVLVESVFKRHGYESQWRTALFKSTDADVLVLRQRTSQIGALLPGPVATADALHSGRSSGAHGQRNGHGAQLVFQHGRALLEVPRHRRSQSRQDCHRAELSAGQRTVETGL